jgi:hypothetical protein
LNNPITPVLIVLAAPDELRIEVAIASFVRQTQGVVRFLLQH